MSGPNRPAVTVVIPIHNEEGLLDTAVLALRQQLAERVGRPSEVLLVENGSSDATADAARALARRHPGDVRVLSLPAADYGEALRAGLLAARADLAICEEIDLCDVGFHARALALLDGDAADLVVGSKAMPGAQDRRPWVRRAATRALNRALRALVGFRGTDTHGLKALRRDALLPVVHACRLRGDLFASELVVRAGRTPGLRVVEIPVTVAEKRPPSVRLLRRAPAVIAGLARLTAALRRDG